MNKSTEEFLASISSEVKFLREVYEKFSGRLDNIEDSIDEVYEKIDNISYSRDY